MVQFPYLSADLVDELDKMFPEVIPEAGDEIISIQRRAAKRELVVFLKHWKGQKARSAERKAKS
ncbi:MAG: hypothetical protein GW859_00335 [Sphingomonadales bacterium]|nr:hypothetical protein [Sphingomonadales bacterium]